MNQSRSYLILVLCAIYSLIAALYPFEFSDRILHFNRELPWQLLTSLAVPLQGVRLDDVLENIAYFLPWGALVYLMRSSRERTVSTVLAAGTVGGVVSLTIELSQIFFVRRPSIFDVLANTIGAVLGALSCALSPGNLRRAAALSLSRLGPSRFLLPVALLLGAVPLLISVHRSPWIDFHNWDRNFTFQIANEASLDRPWLGKIYLVAIYDRALNTNEIARHYRVGRTAPPVELRSDSGLIALYVFNELHGDLVRDISGYDSPLNLTLAPSSHFRWLGESNGLEVAQPGVLSSAGPAKKLYEALQGSGELSVEMWITPANAKQNGPARIVSFSRDSFARNFTVGQEGADIDFRLRTPITGSNGMAVNLRTRNEPLTGRELHLVATYEDGVEKLHLDGSEYPHKVDLKKANIIPAFGANRNPVSQFSYSFLYFFPASFACSWVAFKRSARFPIGIFLPAAIAIGFLSVTECFQAYVFGRLVDVPLIGYGIVVAIGGALCGMLFAKTTIETRRGLFEMRPM